MPLRDYSALHGGKLNLKKVHSFKNHISTLAGEEKVACLEGDFFLSF